MKRQRILLAEDHTLVAEALQHLLAEYYEIVGIVADGQALLKAAIQLRPDMVLADIGMPLLNGLDAARHLRRIMPQVKIIFLTMNTDPHLAAEALAAGASGYLCKTMSWSELQKAIAQMASSDSSATAKATGQTRAGFEGGLSSTRRGKRLTLRQREILQLLAEGHAMKKIAEIAGITPRTVAFHKYRIMEEFQIRSNVELIRFAMRQGVLRAT